jgi:hypothetical protein
MQNMHFGMLYAVCQKHQKYNRLNLVCWVETRLNVSWAILKAENHSAKHTFKGGKEK